MAAIDEQRPRARDIETGALAVMLGAALLLVSLFLAWYADDLTAWSVFEALDLVLAASAIGALLAASARFGAPELIPRVALPYIGALALLVVAAALLDPPPAAHGHAPDLGIWLALVGAVVMLAGAVLSEFGVALSIRFERRTRLPTTPAPVPPPPAASAAPDPSGPDDDTVRQPPDKVP